MRACHCARLSVSDVDRREPPFQEGSLQLALFTMVGENVYTRRAVEDVRVWRARRRPSVGGRFANVRKRLIAGLIVPTGAAAETIELSAVLDAAGIVRLAGRPVQVLHWSAIGPLPDELFLQIVQ